MGQLLTQPPRWKKIGQGRRHAWRNEDIEELPPRESIRHAHRDDPFTQRDFLNPLWNFLKRSIGREWDKVYGEIRRTVDHRNIRGHHLIEHVKNYVQLNPEERYRGPFRVDEHGILREREPRRYGNQVPSVGDLTIKKLDTSTELRWVRGIWYELELGKVDASRLHNPDDCVRIRDAFTNEEIFLNNFEFTGALYERTGVYCVSKRQLSKKELEKHGLR